MTYLQEKLQKGERIEYDYDNKKQVVFDTEIESAMKVIADRLNFMGHGDVCIRSMLGSINKMHRTIQQNFFRAIARVIKEYSQQEYSDLRNKASKEWCKRVAEIEDYFPFI